MNSKQIALAAVAAINDKKGIDPIILDIRKLTDITDYFIVVHGNSDRHVKTLADGIVDSLYEKKEKPRHVEGLNEASWVLIDYVDVIIHVFYYRTREFYNLERLWGDAKVLKPTLNHERKTKKTHRSSTSKNS